MFVQRTESIVIKIAQPTRNKRFWLESLGQTFSDAVQLRLDEAQNLRTSSRAKIHKASYYRVAFGLRVWRSTPVFRLGVPTTDLVKFKSTPLFQKRMALKGSAWV